MNALWIKINAIHTQKIWKAANHFNLIPSQGVLLTPHPLSLSRVLDTQSLPCALGSLGKTGLGKPSLGPLGRGNRGMYRLPSSCIHCEMLLEQTRKHLVPADVCYA